jgi:hypothetical protein
MRSQILIVATKRIAQELAPWAFYIKKVSTGWIAMDKEYYESSQR